MSEFVRERGWYAADSKKPQTAKNLAVSISIESGELLECFQWADRGEPRLVAGELADVLLYAAQLANVLGIDLDAAVRAKLELNRTRQWPDAAEPG